MKISTNRILATIGVILSAAGGAHLFSASEKKISTIQEGYVTIPKEGLCSISVVCGGYGDYICTSFINGQTYQAFGKNSSNLPICQQVLYRAPNN